MYTRKRPGNDTWAVRRGPLVLMGSFVTWTMISWPLRRLSWMGGYFRGRRPRPFPLPGPLPLSRSSSSSASP